MLIRAGTLLYDEEWFGLWFLIRSLELKNGRVELVATVFITNQGNMTVYEGEFFKVHPTVE